MTSIKSFLVIIYNYSWNCGTLNKGELLQIPFIISGGLSNQELFKNLKEDKERANSLIPQVL